MTRYGLAYKRFELTPKNPMYLGKNLNFPMYYLFWSYKNARKLKGRVFLGEGGALFTPCIRHKQRCVCRKPKIVQVYFKQHNAYSTIYAVPGHGAIETVKRFLNQMVDS